MVPVTGSTENIVGEKLRGQLRYLAMKQLEPFPEITWGQIKNIGQMQPHSRGRRLPRNRLQTTDPRDAYHYHKMMMVVRIVMHNGYQAPQLFVGFRKSSGGAARRSVLPPLHRPQLDVIDGLFQILNTTSYEELADVLFVVDFEATPPCFDSHLKSKSETVVQTRMKPVRSTHGRKLHKVRLKEKVIPTIETIPEGARTRL